MNRVIFHVEAKAELRAAVAYYEGQRKGLGREFREAVESAIDAIQRASHAFAQSGAYGARKCVVRRFPYTIFYKELENSNLDRGSGASAAQARVLGGT